jgi:uncharacterized lipoprotein YajG
MQIRSITAVALLAACLLAGCDHAKSAAQVAKDTDAAEQKAVDNVANAEQKADARVTDAAKDVARDQNDLAHVASVQDQKVANTAADGMHKIALAQCESLNGAAQKSCRDQADADYEVAKARAKLARAETDPKP